MAFELPTDCNILCKDDFQASTTFESHWKQKISENPSINLFQSSPAFKAFFILICGLRSTTNDFKTISQQHNVVQMYKTLTEQQAAVHHHDSKEEGVQKRWLI